MGRVRCVESAELLDKYMEEFIAMCEKDDKIPSDYELMRFLNVSPTTLDVYRKGGEKEGDTYYGYQAPFKKLLSYREHRLLRQLEHSKGNNTAAIFQLKQPKNGGYTDNPITTGEQGATVTLKIEGVGGIDAFK